MPAHMYPPIAVRRIDDLTNPEQLLVIALRKRREGPAALACLGGVFLLLCGFCAREQGMLGFEGVFHLLNLRGRRPLKLLEQTDGGLSAHELAALDLLAALQDDDSERARAHGSWLVQGPLVPDLLRHATRLARAMRAHDRWLPVRGRPVVAGSSAMESEALGRWDREAGQAGLWNVEASATTGARARATPDAAAPPGQGTGRGLPLP